MTEPLVVVTRPLAQAHELAARVTALGRQAVLFPLLDIQPLPDTTILHKALAELERYALVAFVSPNAIDAALAVRPDWPFDVPLAVVGEGSRAALARHGLTAERCTIYSPRNLERTDSETLLEELDLAALRGREVLIVRGETGRELLGDTLRAAGVRVTPVAAYRRTAPEWTAERRQELRCLLDSQNDWIVTSSEALRFLEQMVARLDDAQGVAKMQQQRLIVPHIRIADTARSLGFSHVHQSRSGDDGLIAALQSLS
ncbi:uroporphyrinogen-III synthase [uncultured Oxalicibacterium sp.]|uniref:uroporphyrinogen-III synthase n=1 Tax=uncultured Oxalicibacterium sp. TaxID=1168540 RepID=UPI0025CBFF98|nr:uroporphyrinogen-III synthase [uncultured Oxalicibacterium sp.]